MEKGTGMISDAFLCFCERGELWPVRSREAIVRTTKSPSSWDKIAEIV